MKMSLQGSPVKAPLDVAVFKTTKVVRGRQTDYVGWIMNASLAELTPEERVLRYFVRCTNLYGKFCKQFFYTKCASASKLIRFNITKFFLNS